MGAMKGDRALDSFTFWALKTSPYFCSIITVIIWLLPKGIDRRAQRAADCRIDRRLDYRA